MILTKEEQAHLEGAKNLYRYNRGDIINVCVLIGFALAVVAGCWAILHVVDAFGHGCGPYGCHHSFPRTTRLRIPWTTLPTYHPIEGTP